MQTMNATHVDSAHVDGARNGSLAFGSQKLLLLVVNISSQLIGGLSVLLNIFFLVYIARGRKNKFVFQMFFLSLNDCLCGAFLFTVGVLKVRAYPDAVFCAASIISMLMFVTASKGNMLCICIQRLMFARTLRRCVPTWRQRHTIALIATNLLVALCVATFYKVNVTVNTPPYLSPVCTVAIFVKKKTLNPAVVLLFIGILIVFSSDILCFLTIWKLRSGATTTNIVQPTGTSTVQLSGTSTSVSSCRDSVASESVRKTHNHAIGTIAGILVVFNLSYIPMVTAVLLNVAGNALHPLQARTCLLVGYLPCIANPLLLAIRMSSIRDKIKQDFTFIRSTCVRRFQYN